MGEPKPRWISTYRTKEYRIVMIRRSQFLADMRILAIDFAKFVLIIGIGVIIRYALYSLGIVHSMK